jgi:hypothetical protein
VETIKAPGLKSIPETVAAVTTDSSEPRIRQAYRVDDPSRRGELQWNSASPRVNVLIESQMTINQNSAEWVAILRYDVLGGAIDSIHLKLPTPWAAQAQLQLDGTDHRFRSDTLGGATFWTISPSRPIWGTQRLVLRSVVPLLPGQEIQHPEITPLGRGVADTYLGLVYGPEPELTISGSGGLQPFRYASRFQAPEFGPTTGMQTRAYRVERDGWSLKVLLPPASEESRGPDEESARVLSADVVFAMASDRSGVGRALYELQPRTGRFLVAELPPGGTMLAAAVGDSSVKPLLSGDGKWLVPIGDRGVGPVTIYWRQPAPPPAPDRAEWALSLPRAGSGRISTLVTLYLSDGLIVKPLIAGLEVTRPDRAALERADRIARQIGALIPRMDRSSTRDRQHVLTLLIDHELALRSAERSLRASTRREGGEARRAGIDTDLEVIQSSRKSLMETLQTAAVEEEIEVSKRFLGLSSNPSRESPVATPEFGDLDRIRGLGRPTFLIGLSAGINEPAATRITGGFEAPTTPESQTADQARSTLMLGLLFGLTIILAARPVLGRTGFAIVAALLGLLGIVGGPLLLAFALALVVAGSLSTDAPQPSAADSTALQRAAVGEV